MIGCAKRSPEPFEDSEATDLLNSCEVPATGDTIRLYEGNGGATTAFWYLATIQHPDDSAEYMFFHAYGSPFISDVECSTDSTTLIDDGRYSGGVHREWVFSLPEIEEDLIYDPYQLEWGEEE
jgi:hypothetical protein